MHYILVVVDASGSDHRDMAAVFCRILLHQGDDALHLFVVLVAAVGLRNIVGISSQLGKLLHRESQMSSGQRSFHHHGVRGDVVLSVPHLADDHGRLHGGDDRGNPGLGSLHVLRKIYRQTRAGYDDIRAGLHGLLHVLCIISGGHHDIKTDDSLRRNLPCLLKLPADGTQIRPLGIFLKIRLAKADLCRGNDSDSPGLRHRSCKRRQTDPDSHASLYDRAARSQLTYFKRFQNTHYILLNLS